MRKILSFIFAMFMAGSVATVALPVNTYAAECSGVNQLLGLRAWYAGLAEEVNGTCDMKKPPSDGDGIATYVWTIVFNILYDITLLAGLVALILVIFGGYKYILSNGEPGKVAQAKTIITNAMIGLVIAILAAVIVNTILMVIGGAAK
ncbi:hypothetical protein J6X90_01135 [Candidatus Saccharibacteria bacterium]|nr:hypothetical protein [Candidatus Saccharibacteria bacterium]